MYMYMYILYCTERKIKSSLRQLCAESLRGLERHPCATLRALGLWGVFPSAKIMQHQGCGELSAGVWMRQAPVFLGLALALA